MPDALVPIIAFVVGAAVNLVVNWVSGKQEIVSQEKISQAEKNLQEQPDKAKPAWDLARATLEQYFNRNLSQIRVIFWLSVAVMVAGFSVIVWGISQAVQSPNAVAASAIAALAGVITEFIGATFLFIYRSTIQQAMEYSKTLERINSVGMALQIIDTISDDPVIGENELKSKTKAQLVELIMKQVYESSTSPTNANQ